MCLAARAQVRGQVLVPLGLRWIEEMGRELLEAAERQVGQGSEALRCRSLADMAEEAARKHLQKSGP